MEWIATHPHKKPKPLESRKQLSHFYSDGSSCDKTGTPRQTEVCIIIAKQIVLQKHHQNILEGNIKIIFFRYNHCKETN